MTKDTGDFTTFHSVACREYNLPRDDGSSQPRGWIHGDTRVGLVLDVTTSYLFGKHGIEKRIWSVSQDNSHSWVRIFHGSNKFVVDSNNNNTAVLADLPEEQTSQSSVKNYCSQIKGKSKTTKKMVVHAVHFRRVCACRAERRVLWVSWGVWVLFSEGCTSQFLFFRGHLVFQGFPTFVFWLPLSFSFPLIRGDVASKSANTTLAKFLAWWGSFALSTSFGDCSHIILLTKCSQFVFL